MKIGGIGLYPASSPMKIGNLGLTKKVVSIPTIKAMFPTIGNVQLDKLNMQDIGYCNWAGYNTNESIAQNQLPVGGTITKANIYVSANTLDAPNTLVLRVNGIDTACTITIGAGVTGVLTANTNIVIAANDYIDWKYDITSSTSGICYITTGMCEFSVADSPILNSNFTLVNAGFNFAGSTAYRMGMTNNNDVLQAQQPMPVSGTIKSISINVTSNNLNANNTFTIYKNGVSTLVVVTYTPAETGLKITPCNIPFNANDLISVEVSNAAGSGNIVFSPITADIETVGGLLTYRYNLICARQFMLGGISLLYSSYSYIGLENEVRTYSPTTCTIKSMSLNVFAHNNGGTFTATLRKNGVDTGLTITYADTETGVKSVASDVPLIAGDYYTIHYIDNGAVFPQTVINGIEIEIGP